MDKLIGVDISKHNNIDWSKVNPKQISFVIIRAGFGVSTVDPKFRENIEGAIRLGIPVGIYWFSYAGTIAAAEKEAQFCLQTILPYRQYIKYPIWFDWEDDSLRYCKQNGINPTKKLVSDMAIAFMETIKKAGYKTGNYSNPSYMSTYFDERLNNYPLWLAHVANAEGAPLSKTSYKGNYDMWQFSWQNHLNLSGFGSKVDIDYCYVDYLNNQEQKKEEPKYLIESDKLQPAKVVTYSAADGNKFLSPHFQVKEFKCPTANEIKIDNRLIYILERLFKDLKCSKMIITSGYRTPNYSVSVGGTSTDRHTLGQAADIKCYDAAGSIIPAKTVCIKLTEYGDVFGVGYISAQATHVDTRDRTFIWYGDETKNISLIREGYTTFEEYFNGKKLKINAKSWNVRSEPSASGKIVTVAKENEEYVYSKISNGWAYIPKLRGWVCKSGYTIK